ncbi:putative GPI anchored protein [Aspergillus ruber CBS 135680]|uniref:Copper acquisition factor BIM1-like domain-containing protein n=1 Tax=Aspergillus ruber (strain CBS 135680) TaxID=1388766 RepID=A0A017SL06_ASPRC|nr:uncharacterized protein EURHEDRAFT_452138 [Aspergillus ruber CBS 135680]EYE96985.1 hypothetical protein EURHEDRAFT_452138 [Aspergillus ruber CBS 135680]
MKLSILSLTALTPLAAAHFKLDYPTPRGENEDKMTTFPCGGLAQSSERTKVSISDGFFPVAVTMGHTQTAFEVLLSLGNDPGTNFNVTLVPTFGARGLGSLCIPHVAFHEDTLGVNVTDGMNATVQVQSNGDPTGGLYACADIQFSSSTDYPDSSCKNNTNVAAAPFTGEAAQRNANESTANGGAQSGGSSTSDSDSASTSTGGAVALQTAAWGMLGVAVAGGMAVL